MDIQNGLATGRYENLPDGGEEYLRATSEATLRAAQEAGVSLNS